MLLQSTLKNSSLYISTTSTGLPASFIQSNVVFRITRWHCRGNNFGSWNKSL